jgi:hypothetical protein
MESRLTPWNVRLAPPPLHLHAGRTNLTPGLGTPAVDRDQRARIGLLVALGETAGTRRPRRVRSRVFVRRWHIRAVWDELVPSVGAGYDRPLRTYAPVRGGPRAESGGRGRSTPGPCLGGQAVPASGSAPKRQRRAGPVGPWRGAPAGWPQMSRELADLVTQPTGSGTGVQLDCTTTRPPWMRTPWPKRSSDTPRRAGSRSWPPRTGPAHPSPPHAASLGDRQCQALCDTLT